MEGRRQTARRFVALQAHLADTLSFSTVVARAFQILSDADKKAKYDRFGGDPESRFGAGGGGGGGGATASPFSGFAQSAGGRRGMWEEEISPEDLFRQFFGGGGMGGGFGGLGESALLSAPYCFNSEVQTMVVI